jgi:hypothetical protein
MATTFKFTLEADGFSAIDLPVSSFSYRSSRETFTGTCIVEGHDYSAEIADRIAGDLKLFQVIDGTSTEVFSATITDTDITQTTGTKNISITFDSGTYSQSVFAAAITVDNIISGFHIKGTYAEWNIPYIDPSFQHVMFVDYQGIEYYVSDIAVSGNADSATTALNEGDPYIVYDNAGCATPFGHYFTLSNSCAVHYSSPRRLLDWDDYNILDNYIRVIYINFEYFVSPPNPDGPGVLEKITYLRVITRDPIDNLTFDGTSHHGAICSIAKGEFKFDEVADTMSNYEYVQVPCNASIPQTDGFRGSGYHTLRVLYFCPSDAPDIDVYFYESLTLFEDAPFDPWA